MGECDFPIPLGSTEYFSERSGGVIHRCVGDERAIFQLNFLIVDNPMPSTPSNQPGHIVIGDFGQ
jgi:hypothetical protein